MNSGVSGGNSKGEGAPLRRYGPSPPNASLSKERSAAPLRRTVVHRAVVDDGVIGDIRIAESGVIHRHYLDHPSKTIFI
jgi:hypothetical protein